MICTRGVPYVVYLFSSPYYLTTWCETHMPRCLSLFLPILSDDMVWNTHTTSSISFPPHIIWRRSVKPTHHVVYLFSSPYYLTMRCETHMPHRLVLFLPILSDDAVCNPHAASSISFPPHIIWWRSVKPTCHVVYFFSPHIIWQHSVQPTRCVVYFFSSSYYLTMWHATHTPCHLFSSSFPPILSDDVVWNPHTTSSIPFPPILSDDTAWNPHTASSIPFPLHIIWRHGYIYTIRVY